MNKQKREIRRGVLRLHRDGYGFVVPGGDQEDLFIPAHAVGDALHTDVVEAEVMRRSHKGEEGRITKIVERKVKRLIVRLEQAGKQFQAVVDDQRISRRIFIPRDKVGDARSGQSAIVEILAYPRGEQPMMGRVVEVLGRRGTKETEVKAVIVHHDLPEEFPDAVEKEAQSSRMDEADYAGRLDLRHLPFITIDGESAQDFDDAVAVEELPGDLFRLWVSIADVAHFVRPGSQIDREAYTRATSVYFPGMCIPMLPEKLSNDLCSLRADVDRFTMTASLDIDRHGEVIASKFYQSVIKSRRRTTYTDIKAALLEKKRAVLHAFGDLVPELHKMERCFKRLKQQRVARGSIDFDLPEPLIVIDLMGGVETIVKAERHIGHMMIEEFMIAANEAVARFLTAAKLGCVYRNHEAPPPAKLHEFSLLLHNLGHHIRIPKDAPPKKLAQVVTEISGKPYERLANHMLLRSMSKAVYGPENLGHYGLASRCYCHFTSPIRRYPDLIVHRLLKRALQASSHASDGEKSLKVSLKESAEHCSQRERVSMEAERETAKLYAALFMKQHTDKELEGVISHVTKFGFFVELLDYFVEGLVPAASLAPGKFRFDEKGMSLSAPKGPSFHIGQTVRIRVEEVKIPEREIVFELISSELSKPSVSN